MAVLKAAFTAAQPPQIPDLTSRNDQSKLHACVMGATGPVETLVTQSGLEVRGMRAILGPLVLAALLVTLWVRFFSGNPGDISDARYSEFKRLASPKLLYSCTMKPTSAALLQLARECVKSGRSGCEQKSYDVGEAKSETIVEFAGGSGTSTYDDLLLAAKRKCAAGRGSMGNGKFTVLESEKN